MSTEAQKVDVLAELRRQGVTGKVIKAVADLIEAAEDVERRAGPEREPRLRAALARVGGAA
jgi:hypothetical protein